MYMYVGILHLVGLSGQKHLLRTKASELEHELQLPRGSPSTKANLGSSVLSMYNAVYIYSYLHICKRFEAGDRSIAGSKPMLS